MSENQDEHDDTTTNDVIAVVVTAVILSNGVLSALVGSWVPTIAALGLIVAAGVYGSKPPKCDD